MSTADRNRALRRSLRQKRRALSRRQQRVAAVAVAQRLATWPPFRRAGLISAYLAFDGELDPGPSMQLAWQLGKRVCLPVIGPGGSMHFRELAAGAPLKPNRYGILESRTGRRHPASRIDLVLLPLVGFDASGHRLGMGGGYYDRCFARHLLHPAWTRSRLIGIAHAIQEVGRITVHPWDVPLDAVLTECGLIRPGRSPWTPRQREAVHRGPGSTSGG